jgi:hypothetical protein
MNGIIPTQMKHRDESITPMLSNERSVLEVITYDGRANLEME